MAITSFTKLLYASRPVVRKLLDEQRPNARERGYDKEWERFSRDYRELHPLCIKCLAAGRTEASTCVDHIKPLRDHPELKYEPSNLQPLCDACHNAKTRSGQ